MKKLALSLLFIFFAISAQAQNLADNIDCEMLLNKISANASATFDATNYNTNLLAVYINPSEVNATDTISIQVEGSLNNSDWAPITNKNLLNGVVDASGTVILYNDEEMTAHTDEVQLIGAKYFRVNVKYDTATSAADITVMTLKGGKIIGK